jgi:hypothetical protein
VTRYAAKTTVPVARSRDEIERTLTRYGASAFGYGWDGTRTVVSFRVNDRFVRLSIDESGSDQHQRQQWRALLLVIKAKLEAVASGITTFEEEFLAHVVLPDNRTVGEWLAPQLDQAYEDGGMPKLLMPGR